jgi:hypothetical protein
MVGNPYPGIDAHVNSMLQTPSTPEQPAIWHSFHTQHITHIMDALNAQIMPQFIALGEQSLQTRGYDTGGQVEIMSPVPDVTIFQQTPVAIALPPQTAVQPKWRARLAEVLEPIPQPRAILIREMLPQSRLGQIVARIELLSPSNKPGGSHYQGYNARRISAIDTGVPLIEIDYLHEQRSPELRLPRYPQVPDAYPYHVLINDPRAGWDAGEVQAFSFHLNEPLTSFPLPLPGVEGVVFDLNAAYQHSLTVGPWRTIVDYTQPPERFDTYSADDQAFIRQMMAQINQHGAEG